MNSNCLVLVWMPSSAFGNWHICQAEELICKTGIMQFLGNFAAKGKCDYQSAQRHKTPFGLALNSLICGNLGILSRGGQHRIDPNSRTTIRALLMMSLASGIQFYWGCFYSVSPAFQATYFCLIEATWKKSPLCHDGVGLPKRVCNIKS